MVSSAPMLEVPSTRNWTPATATLSEAVACSATVPDTVPAAGAVIETVGGVVSAVTTADASLVGGPRLPAASFAATR